MRFFPKLSLNRLRGASILDEVGELVFQVPPFTQETVDSIRRISTRLPFRADEDSRLLCEKEANGMSEREYHALEPFFRALPPPRRILEIGPGFGRSAVYFAKKKVWDETAMIDLYDTDGIQTKYKQKFYDQPPKWPDVSSFCGNLELLRSFLDFNQVGGCTIVDARTAPLTGMKGPYDLIYGFFSIGYHWSLDFYLDELLPQMHERSLLVCTLNKHYKPFPRLKEFWSCELALPDTKVGAPPMKLLALSRTPIQIGQS